MTPRQRLLWRPPHVSGVGMASIWRPKTCGGRHRSLWRGLDESNSRSRIQLTASTSASACFPTAASAPAPACLFSGPIRLPLLRPRPPLLRPRPPASAPASILYSGQPPASTLCPPASAPVPAPLVSASTLCPQSAAQHSAGAASVPPQSAAPHSADRGTEQSALSSDSVRG